MSQTPTPSAWCAQIQAKLMAALDAAWALAETSADPAVIAAARDKARLCGQMASDARKIAALVPEQKPRQLPAPLIAEAARQQVRDAGKPPAAQALAMQAALKKLKRR